MNVNDQDYGFPFIKPVKLTESTVSQHETGLEDFAAGGDETTGQLSAIQASRKNVQSGTTDDFKEASSFGSGVSPNETRNSSIVDSTMGATASGPYSSNSTKTASKQSRALTYFLISSIVLLLSVMAYFLYYMPEEREDSIEEVQNSKPVKVITETVLPKVVNESLNDSSVTTNDELRVNDVESLEQNKEIPTTIGEQMQSSLRGKITEIQSKEQASRYFIVVGSVPNLNLAMEESEKYLRKGVDLWMILPNEDSKNVRLAIGKYNSFREASSALESAKTQFNESVWILKY